MKFSTNNQIETANSTMVKKGIAYGKADRAFSESVKDSIIKLLRTNPEELDTTLEQFISDSLTENMAAIARDNAGNGLSDLNKPVQKNMYTICKRYSETELFMVDTDPENKAGQLAMDLVASVKNGTCTVKCTNIRNWMSLDVIDALKKAAEQADSDDDDDDDDNSDNGDNGDGPETIPMDTVQQVYDHLMTRSDDFRFELAGLLANSFTEAQQDAFLSTLALSKGMQVSKLDTEKTG